MSKKYIILSVEDSEPDYILLKDALHKIKDINFEIKNVITGQEAIDYISKEKNYKDAPTPDLILLDLNLPVINGYEVLEFLKTNNELKSIPTIIYTSSEDPKDIRKTYSMHANSYIHKTHEIKTLFKRIDTMGKYWFQESKIPSK